MKDKIMRMDDLDNIAGRLSGCIAMLVIVHANLAGDNNIAEALYGCIDLLESISRDFDADVASSEDYIPVAGVVA